MNNHNPPHVLLLSQHPHGHLNPTLQLATNFIRAGARVTLVTTVSGFHKLKRLPPHPALSFASITDGHDNDPNAAKSPGYVHDLNRLGSLSLANLIRSISKTTGNKPTLLVYTLFLPWAAAVARALHVPSALLLIQSATSFSIYNRFFNNHDGIFAVNKHIDSFESDTSFSLSLPGISPVFKWGDFPTFALPTSPMFSDMNFVIQQHLQFLEKNPDSHVLVNTLQGLETDSVNSIKNAVIIGPLVPSLPSSFSGDSDSDSYFEWLDSKPDKSVVLVSFGSMAVLTKAQKVEMLHGLIECNRWFLLVLRETGEDEGEEIERLKEEVIGQGERGLIVGWCSQVEVLRHGAIGCFVTHCGWNSVLESMVAGVPVVGYPQFADQTTNAKMVEEVWGVGVRAVVDGGMVVGREEIERCLRVVMDGGERAEGIKRQAEKWKMVAEEAVKDGGCLVVNLKMFLGKIQENN